MNSDPFLLALLELVNTSDFAVGITLNVHGLVITGELIGQATYFHAIAQTLEAALDPSTARAFAAHMQQRTRAKPIPCIHLRDARLVDMQGSTLPERGALWRGRADAVDGFFVGRLF